MFGEDRPIGTVELLWKFWSGRGTWLELVLPPYKVINFPAESRLELVYQDVE